MPVLLTIGAVAVIAILMVIGVRHRWDPSPGPLPPSSMSVPARAPMPLPRGYWVLFIVGTASMIVLVAISLTTDRPWLATSGLVLFVLSWAARQTLLIWTSSETSLGRIAAVLRPASLLLGGLAAAVTASGWWLLGGAIVYLAILPLADVLERKRGHRSTSGLPSPPGSGDGRR
jgi:hypothetical protein